MNAVIKRNFDRDRHMEPPDPFVQLPQCSLLVCFVHWFLLHIVMAHSAIKYALLPLLPLPDTEHPEILLRARQEEEEDAGLSNSSPCQAIQSSGRPSYSTPSTLSWSHSQFKPFRSRQNQDDRQIPTHTDTVE